MVNNKENNFVSAVIYVHNSEDKLKNFLDVLYKVLSGNFNKFEIICVNDCSTDGSIREIRNFAAYVDNAMVSIVNMSIYQGIELSMNAGVDLSIGDFVFEFDNLSVDYEPSMIMEIYHHSLKGYDIVSAAPKVMAKMSSKLFYWLYNKYSKSMYKLRSETFRILSRRAINRVLSISKTIPYRKALYVNCGLKVDTLLYDTKKRPNVHFSKQVEENRREVATDTMILFTDVAYKFSLTLSTILLLLTLASGIYTCAVFFGQHRPVPGWTTTMLLLSGGFFGIFLILSIIIKYLSVLVELIFKRQKYLVESIEKITK